MYDLLSSGPDENNQNPFSFALCSQQINNIQEMILFEIETTTSQPNLSLLFIPALSLLVLVKIKTKKTNVNVYNVIT